MYFYVTEKIKTYRKIGIAKDIVNRYAQYQTLIPDLTFDIFIKLPNSRYARIFENSFKRHLAHSRIRKTECYEASFKEIRNLLFFLTVIFDLTLLEYRLRYQDWYEIKFKRGLKIEDNRGPKWSNDGYIYLNELYFGKKVPILEVERITKNKLKVKIIKFRNTWKELSKITNISIDNLRASYISSNIFYQELRHYDGKIINCNNTPNAIKNFFNQIIKDKLHKIFSKKEHSDYSKHWNGAIETQKRFKNLKPESLKRIKLVVMNPYGTFRKVGYN